MDPARDPCLTRRLLRGEDVAVEARLARVAAREPVELFARPVLDQLDPAANQKEPGRVVRIDDEQARPRIPLKVTSFAPFPCGVDAGALAVVVDPDQARARLPVRHQRRQDTAGMAGEEIAVRLGDHFASSVTILSGRILQSTGVSFTSPAATRSLK